MLDQVLHFSVLVLYLGHEIEVRFMYFHFEPVPGRQPVLSHTSWYPVELNSGSSMWSLPVSDPHYLDSLDISPQLFPRSCSAQCFAFFCCCRCRCFCCCCLLQIADSEKLAFFLVAHVGKITEVSLPLQKIEFQHTVVFLSFTGSCNPVNQTWANCDHEQLNYTFWPAGTWRNDINIGSKSNISLFYPFLQCCRVL